MASEWLYFKNGQQAGPVGTAQLKHLAATGKLSPGDLVWREGMAEWIGASGVKGLFVEGPAGEASRALASSAQVAPLETFNSPETRAAVTLKGFAPANGRSDHWPLTEEDLRALAKAESHRNRIRTLTILFHVCFVLGVIFCVWMMMQLIVGTMRGGSLTIEGAFVFFLMLGQTVLLFFSARANRMCHLWPSIVWMIIYSVSVVADLGLLFYALNYMRRSEGAAIGSLVGVVVHSIFIYLCVAANGAIPRFLKCPVWTQEALVNAKL